MKTQKAGTVRRAASPVVESATGAADAPDASEGVHPDAPTDETEGAEQGGANEATGATVARVGFAPIVRVDAALREIELCATSEALDSYGTVFDYAASKDAFTRWMGNVREMHERRAVGSRVSVRCDDEQRKVYVRVRISRGAEDTWEKVRDGTLRGASIGASNVVWERQARRVAGRERLLNVATRYDLVELSLVDSPSNPDALGITIVRDAVPDATMLDDLTGSGHAAQSGRPPDAPTVDVDVAAGAAGSAPTAADAAARRDTSGTPVQAGGGPNAPDDTDASPEVRIARQAAAHGWAAVRAARGGENVREEGDRGDNPPGHGTDGVKPAPAQPQWVQLPLPGCGDLEPTAPSSGADTRARGPFSANAEGYPDVGVPARAEARPTSALGPREEGNARERFHAAARGILLGCGCPLCEGALAALGEMGTASESEMRDGGVGASGGRPESGGRPDGAVREFALVRALASGLSASVARMERVDEGVRGLGGLLQAAVSQMEGTVESAASDLRRRIETLEAQPLPGGPAAFAFEKSLALTSNSGAGGGIHGQPGAAEQRRALESLAGKLTDPQAQIAVAAELIRLQRGE